MERRFTLLRDERNNKKKWNRKKRILTRNKIFIIGELNKILWDYKNEIKKKWKKSIFYFLL